MLRQEQALESLDAATPLSTADGNASCSEAELSPIKGCRLWYSSGNNNCGVFTESLILGYLNATAT